MAVLYYVILIFYFLKNRVPVIIAEDPLTCVARGGGEALEMIDMHGGDIFSDEI